MFEFSLINEIWNLIELYILLKNHADQWDALFANWTISTAIHVQSSMKDETLILKNILI